ncbi:MAG: hypothetical protein ACRDTC_28710 [Pseudonocardiaceae bacterium]
MVGTGELIGLAGRGLAVLLVFSSSCVGADDIASIAAPPAAPVAAPVAGLSAIPGGPAVVDTEGAPLTDEHAEVVRSVHRALMVADLDTLGALYAGDDWVGQADLLARPEVRESVLTALRVHPANLGEGYVYPGLTVIGLGGYQTAFFLDYDPPRTEGGPLRWRGIAPPAS